MRRKKRTKKVKTKKVKINVEQNLRKTGFEPAPPKRSVP
jgi:hypothetical protein